MISGTENEPQAYARQAGLFKVLTHPARLAILEILRDGEHCVCHMEAHLGLRQAYISQQLIVLREAGIIQDRRDGWNIYYRVARPEIFQLVDAASQMLDEPAPTLEPGKNRADCPCPKCSAEREITNKEKTG